MSTQHGRNDHGSLRFWTQSAVCLFCHAQIARQQATGELARQFRLVAVQPRDALLGTQGQERSDPFRGAQISLLQNVLVAFGKGWQLLDKCQKISVRDSQHVGGLHSPYALHRRALIAKTCQTGTPLLRQHKVTRGLLSIRAPCIDLQTAFCHVVHVLTDLADVQ